MKYTLSEVLSKIEADLKWHSDQKDYYAEGSPDWNFHLGWLDALTAYRYKLQYIQDNSK